ncbi:DNA polymerase III subunit alpha [Candidatus Nomurabacteria bacterium]|nr:DNA polymerase III subunit alpha [Candidatus Nomurabacteria bacterium]
MTSNFIHLHTHSHYSLLDGLSKVEDMVRIAKEHNMSAMAITDHGNMYGAIEFYKKCNYAGIKPIIGCEVYVAERGMRDKEPGIDNKRYHLILLAKNITGYKNLMKIVTKANLEGYYYKPRVDSELLREYSEGIICLSGCMGGKLSKAILADNMEKAEALILEHQDIFGKENYFIEIQSHPHIERDRELREKLAKLAKKFDIPLVATQDSHYPCKDDHKAHHTLLQVNTGTDGKDSSKFEFSDDDFSLIDEKTALEYFKGYEEAVTNTKMVSDMCESYDLELGRAYFPNYILENGITAEQELRRLIGEGLIKRNVEKTTEVNTRIEYELGIIVSKGYPSYFLVVADLLKFSKEQGILTNTRGSAAGSLISYLIGITNINPIEYKLPFERFLNPERPSLPDIDMDFADNRRDEVIEYAKQKYGEDKVAQIGTFGTMMAKGSVRDVARALGYPYNVGDRISSMIPLGSQGFAMTIDHALEIVPELAEAYAKEKETKEIIDLAKKMEGCVRHVSVHAAGIVIAPTELYNFTPIQYDPKGGHIITQYDMYNIEDVGLPKFDFLGIRNLSILSEAIRLVKLLHSIDIDIEKIPINDKKTYEMLARGETIGLFQLNGSGMTKYLKDLRPTDINDINAMVALYRPGPMAFIPDYIKRKHNPSLVKYLDPRLKEFLETTYGILIYQDDVLLIAVNLAGYTWGEADLFRKAIGKKIPEEMDAQEEKFTKGLIANKMTPAKAKAMWSMIETFAAYGFNKAHAASYGMVAYQTAYMKANYPVEYMCAILTAESGDVEKINEIVEECKKMNIVVLPPDVNESFGGFTVIHGSANSENKTIRFGLYTIKNLGTDIADAIIAERKNKGPFKTLADFFERINHKNLNKKSVEALAKTGAMDNLGERANIIGNLERLLAFNKETRGVNSQDSLFGSIGGLSSTLTLIPLDPATQKDMLMWERELLGLYVSGHPLDAFKEKIAKFGTVIKKIREESENGMPVTVACIIDTVRPIMTKNNDRMAFIKISDFTGTIEAVVFSKLFETQKELLVPDTIIAISGKVTLRNGEKSLVIENLKRI